MFHLSISGPFGMVFEHLQDSFNPKDLTSGFIQLHQLCSHVVTSRIFGSMVHALGLVGFWFWPSLLMTSV
jgi:hypothetical protein